MSDKPTPITKGGSAEFFQDGNVNGDKIEIFDEWEGKLVVEYSLRVPKDPRGFKRVVTKSGTWTSSKEAILKPDEKQKPTKENYDAVVRTYESATSLTLAGDGTTSIQLVTSPDEAFPSFTYGGKVFKMKTRCSFNECS